MRPQVLVLDSGAQLYNAICRVSEELGVEALMASVDIEPREFEKYEGGVIISGGGASVYQKDAPSLHPEVLQMIKNNPGKWPLLGICYGMQLLNHLFGGKVAPLGIKEYGKTFITKAANSRLLAGTPDVQRVLMSHGDSIEKIADGFQATAHSQDGLIAAMENVEHNIYGVQFHPEAVAISTHGRQIIENFLYFITRYQRSQPKNQNELMREQKEKVREGIPKTSRAYVGLSGGVDSAVAAAVAEDVHGAENCVGFILDLPYLRKGEGKWVHNTLSIHLDMPIHLIPCEEHFLYGRGTIGGQPTKMLSEEKDPARKRTIFRQLYQKLFDEVAKKHGLNTDKKDPKRDRFIQGTLRPDDIESASKDVSKFAKQIKEHHNSDLDSVNPNEDLQKDQVRAIALDWGLPPEIAFRQPFPGPGLLVRTVCADEPTINDKYNRTAVELKEYSDKRGLETLLLPINSVGIKGDDRSVDFAAVIAGEPDFEKLVRIADEMPRFIHGVNRVLYAFDTKLAGLDPRSLITPTFCTKDTLDLLREANAVVDDHQERAGIDSRQIAQFPVSLLPINFGQPGMRAIDLAPVITPDFYTSLPAIPSNNPSDNEHIDEKVIFEMAKDVRAIKGIGTVLYCLSGKPPRTTEWE